MKIKLILSEIKTVESGEGERISQCWWPCFTIKRHVCWLGFLMRRYYAIDENNTCGVVQHIIFVPIKRRHLMHD